MKVSESQLVLVIKSHFAKSTLNKTESTLNKTYTGLMSMFQDFQIYFAWNVSCKGVKGPCLASQSIQPESVWIGCAAQHGSSMPYNLEFHAKCILILESYLFTSDATELSSACLSLDLARAGGLLARLSSARVVLGASSVSKILLKRAEILFLITLV